MLYVATVSLSGIHGVICHATERSMELLAASLVSRKFNDWGRVW